MPHDRKTRPGYENPTRDYKPEIDAKNDFDEKKSIFG